MQIRYGKLAFLFLPVWFISYLSQGQSFTFYNYSIMEGLPSSEVYDAFQDSKGFIWFATDNGVVRFDGKEMATFQAKEGLSDPVVFGFYEDKKGRLWFRTFSGKLCYYENGKIKKYRRNEQLLNFIHTGILYKIYVEEDEDIWFSTSHVIGKIDSTGVVVKEPTGDNNFFFKTIGSEDMWCASVPGVNRWKVSIDHRQFEIALTSPKNYSYFYCTIIWKGKTYFSINNHVFQYDGKSVTKVFAAEAPIISLSKDKEDNLWLGYKGAGAERFFNADFTKPWRPSFTNEKSVTRVLQDHEGGLWFTTLEKGVYYVPNLMISHYSLPDGLKATAVLSTLKYVLVGDQTGVLYAFDPEEKIILWKKYFDSRIMAIFCDKDGKLWINNGGKLFILDKVNKVQRTIVSSVVNFSGGPDDYVWSVGYTNVSKFDLDGFDWLNKSTKYIYRSILADDSLIFMAPRTGLHVSDHTLETISIFKKFDDYKVSKLTSLNDSVLLVSTIGNGFILLNKKNWQYKEFNTDNHFIANNIYDVIKTDSMLWLGTDKGLVSTYVKPLLSGNFSFDQINQRSGLKSNKINFLASSKHSIWVFSDEGISTVPYQRLQVTSKNPLFYFKTLTVNAKPFNFKDDITLSYDENNIQLTFGYISFNNPDIITRYRLGVNHPWIQVPERSIQFSSLSPGAYALELEYSTDNRHWNRLNNSLFITVLPPLWQKWYFQMGAILILLLLAYIYYRNRLLIYKQKLAYFNIAHEYQQKLILSRIETLERERSRIAKELHDGVSASLVAIKLRVNKLLGRDKNIADDLEEQFQNTFKEIKDTIYALVPPGLERYGLITSLKHYVKKLNETVSEKIEFNAFGKEIYDPELSIPLFRVVQELIANSLKHAQANNITIHINSFDDLLSILYDDDGIGFSESEVQRGMGLDNIAARIKSVKGKLKFESRKFGVFYSIDIPVQLK